MGQPVFIRIWAAVCKWGTDRKFGDIDGGNRRERHADMAWSVRNSEIRTGKRHTRRRVLPVLHAWRICNELARPSVDAKRPFHSCANLSDATRHKCTAHTLKASIDLHEFKLSDVSSKQSKNSNLKFTVNKSKETEDGCNSSCCTFKDHLSPDALRRFQELEAEVR